MNKVDSGLHHVCIKSDGSGRAQLHIDGRPVKGLIEYKVEQNASDMREPVLSMKVFCNLEMDTGAIPLLPEPWSWFYKPISDNFTDGHEFGPGNSFV